MSLTSFIKGWSGELKGTLAKKILLDARTYKDINNVTIPTCNGSTQIDHVIVSRHGVFVVETKNMTGWIYGDANSKQWTQCLYGEKYRFQNPLHQNYRHTRALSALLGITHTKCISIVMFWGDCTLKTPLPPNVLTRGYTSFIKSHQEILFSDQEVDDLVATLRKNMLARSWSTSREHISSLQARHSSTSLCPRCGKPLKLRVAKSGCNAGTRFYGCSEYPSCRFTKPALP